MFSYSNWSVLTVNFLVVLYLALGGVTLVRGAASGGCALEI